jgi:hypothetical protein
MRQTQDTWLDGKHTAVDESSGLGIIDSERVAACYGVEYRSIDNNEEVTLELMLLKNEQIDSIIYSVLVSPGMIITPKLKFGKSIGDIE